MKVFSFKHFKEDVEARYGKCTAEEADFYIVSNFVPTSLPLDRCILILTEPPLAGCRVRAYKSISKFHTAITFIPSTNNSFNFGGSPLVYPYNPMLERDTLRNSTVLTKRGIYYAGHRKKKYPRMRLGYTNLYPVRESIGAFLLKHHKESYIYGRGWPKVSKQYNKKLALRTKPFREQKLEEIDRHNCDFVLCSENMHMPNYVSEKIHDGFSSDRLVLYLGCKNITDFVPEDCFINLNKHLKSNGSFNPSIVLDIITSISQEEYDTYIKKARAFRKTLVGKWEQAKKETLALLFNRIEGVK